MMTLSGRLLTLDNDEAPSISDIAVGLSRTNRFGGQTFIPWNDAQHSLVCGVIALEARWPKRMQLIMMLHDAHEMITGDACRPFKPAGMSALQKQLDARIYRSLGLVLPTAEEEVVCDTFDNAALVAEAYVVAPSKTYLQAARDVGSDADVRHVDIVWKVLNRVQDSAQVYEKCLRSLLKEVHSGG